MKFWNWITNDAGERILRLEGPIDEETLWGDEITPAMFREELESGEGDVTVWINSPGGNCFAASEIYTMLKDYKGAITVKIDAIAASAASVIAMAGDRVLMSPTALLMIHDPSTIAMGNEKDLGHAIEVLSEVKESIINAYASKTGLSHARISNLMSNESWMNAKKAVELGFADEILFTDKKPEEEEDEPTESEEESPDEPDEDEPDEGEEEDDPEKKKNLKASLFSTRQMDLAILNRLLKNQPDPLADSGSPKVPTIAGSIVVPSVGVALPSVDSTTASSVYITTDSIVINTPYGEDVEPDEPTEPDEPPAPSEPVIGLDGTTEDGSVPYLILQKQLECLK